MHHFEKIARGLADQGLDAMLLTGEANRFYASGFHSAGTDGVALVTKEKAYYFTDSRYTEAAERCVRDAEIQEVGRGRWYPVLLEEAIKRHHIARMGYEDAYMTVRDYESYRKALSCELVPAAEFLWRLRMVKDPEELEAMEGAQRIAEAALEQILGEIRPGVTEKEIAARLQYLMLHLGASDMSFDPIVVSGVNGSLPHGVPSEKTIQDGEFVFIMGRSGSGKSTLLKLLLKELEPTSGQIIVNDMDLEKMPRRYIPKYRRRLGMVFQDFRLLKDRNVYDNVAFAQKVVGEPNSHIKKKVPLMLSMVGLAAKYRSFPKQLSGGEQQRVAIARALINEPSILLADEPTGNLDNNNAWEIMKLLEEINSKGTTVIVVTHNLEIVKVMKKRVITVKKGTIVSDSKEGGYDDEN